MSPLSYDQLRQENEGLRKENRDLRKENRLQNFIIQLFIVAIVICAGIAWWSSGQVLKMVHEPIPVAGRAYPTSSFPGSIDQ